MYGKNQNHPTGLVTVAMIIAFTFHAQKGRDFATQRTSLIFKNPYEVELRQDNLPSPSQDDVLIKTRLSAISAGTEMLVYRGQFPATLQVDELIAAHAQPLRYPLKYGL